MTHELLVSFIVVAIVASVAGGIDVWKFRVPNVITLPLALSGVVFHTAVDGVTGLVSSLVGIFFAMAVLGLFFAMGVIGAGDVKLMGGVGAWLGLPVTWYVFLVSALAGGVYSAILLTWYGGFSRVWNTFYALLLQCAVIGKYLGVQEGVHYLATSADRRRRLVPFAAMIALAVIIVAAIFGR